MTQERKSYRPRTDYLTPAQSVPLVEQVGDEPISVLCLHAGGI
jgi:hypothetical protein